MKRKSLIFSLFVLSFFLPTTSLTAGVTGASYDDAYKAIVKIYTYYENGTHYLVAVQSGSGVIIDDTGTILTNAHIVNVDDDFGGYLPVAFEVCVTVSSTKKPECKYSADLLAKDEDKDIALLRIKDISTDPRSVYSPDYTYLKILNEKTLKEGEKVEALGYPGAGGETITLSDGTISGQTVKYGINWIKTSALVSYGSSGGALIDMSGNLLGITSAANSDLGYAIDIKSIGEWITKNKTSFPQQSVLQERMNNVISLEQGLQKSNTYSSSLPFVSITKPKSWEFYDASESYVKAYNPENRDGGSFSLTWLKGEVETKNILDALMKLVALKGDCFEVGKITLAGRDARKIICQSGEEEFAQLLIPSKNFLILLSTYNGKKDIDKDAIDQVLSSVKFSDQGNNFKEQRDYQNQNPYFKIQLPNTWALMPLNLKSLPVSGQSLMVPELGFSIKIRELTANMQAMTNASYFDFIRNDDTIKYDMESSYGLKGERYFESMDFTINNELKSKIAYKYKFKDENDSNKIKAFAAGYRIRTGDRVIIVTVGYFGDNQELFDKYAKDFERDVLSRLTLGLASGPAASPNMTASPTSVSTPRPATSPVVSSDPVVLPSPTSVVSKDTTEWEANEKNKVKNIDKNLLNRFKGQILLQVEEHGEAWYIDPKTLNKYYLKDGPTAYNALRKFGVGIKNADLAKIPVGAETRFVATDSDNDGLIDNLEEALKTDPAKADTDGDGVSDGVEVLKNNTDPLGKGALVYSSALINIMKGKILLQVESHGEAWYVNPKDGKRYYLKNGEAAYQIMRFLSTGMSNDNIRKLPIGSIN